MNVSAIFIRRPVATILLSVALTLGGLFAYGQLPVAALPQVDFPTVSVSAQLPGASPDTMATAVATPLIKQLSIIPAIQQISTTSSQGATSITVEFELGRDIDQAAADVQAAIARTQRQLPIEMTTPPSYRKLNPADAPILQLALQSDTTPLPKLDAFAQQVISPALSTIDGVGQVQIFGSQKYAVRIQLDPDLLAARGIGVDEIETAVGAANANTPVGTVQGRAQNLTIEAQTGLADAAGFRDLIIATRNGHPIRLGEVARVIDSVENNQQASSYDGQRSLVLGGPAAARRQHGGGGGPGQGDAAAAHGGTRPDRQHPYPERPLGLGARRGPRRPDHALVTVGLVVLVIYLFLGRLGATAIPTIAVPVSIVTTFGAMQLLGYSIDNISLLALTLSVGLVVDDAIVMLENIVRHIDDGMPPLQAALKGSGEIGFTIVSITVSLVAVFIPVLLMGGVVGRVFHEFAIVVTIAIAASAFVSLTLTPMLCARLPAHAGPQHRNLFERAFDRVQAAYGVALDLCLRARPLMLLLFIATVGVTVWLFRDIPKGFFPQEDIGQLSIQTEARQDISFPAMQALQQEAEAVLERSPHVAHVASIVGSVGAAGTLNNGRFFVELKPRAERAPLPQVVADLRRDLGRIAGIGSFIVPVQNLSFGGRSSKSQYQFVVQGIDRDELYDWATRLADRMGRDHAFTDVASDLQNTALQARIVIDRDKARSLGITAEQLRSTLYTGFGSRQASTIYATGDSYAVIVEFDPRIAWSADRLDDVRVAASSGRVVPLSAFARVERVAGPLAINQLGQLPAVTVSFNLPQGVALGDAVQRIDAIKSELGVPATISTTFSGTARVFQEALANQGLLLLAAVVTIYIVLGILYESFIHPLTILTGLPAAAVGALGALTLFGQDLSVIAIIGLLMLIGIVKKNAIMMVDVALVRQREGMSPLDAIRDACLLRFRPIMMTTLAALMGTLPIAIGHGASAELRQPLGIAVVGGLLVSQLLTLFITPVLYIYMEDLAGALRRLFWRRTRSVSGAAA